MAWLILAWKMDITTLRIQIFMYVISLQRKKQNNIKHCVVSQHTGFLSWQKGLILQKFEELLPSNMFVLVIFIGKGKVRVR